MVAGGPRWFKMVQDGPRWFLMIYDRYLVVPGPKFSHMVHGLGGSLIVQVGPWSFRVLDGL